MPVRAARSVRTRRPRSQHELGSSVPLATAFDRTLRFQKNHPSLTQKSPSLRKTPQANPTTEVDAPVF
jgi:hypothetical protein